MLLTRSLTDVNDPRRIALFVIRAKTGDVDALRDPARDRPAPQVVPGESGAVASGLSDPFFDDEGDRIGVDRIGTNPVAVSYRLSSDGRYSRRKSRPLGDLGGMSRRERL
jgi:hypothetical protein